MMKKLLIGVLLALTITLGGIGVSANAQCVEKQQNMPKGQLNFGEKSLYAGEKMQLKLTGAQAAEWVSNHPKVATVSSTGEVVAKKAGYANVVAKVSEDEVYVCKLVVKDPELSKTDSFMFKGASQTIKLQGAKVKNWKSSKPSVAAVTKSGKVTAKAKGTAVLTCTDTNGKTYKCQIKVSNKSEADGYNVDQIKKKIGKYEINKIYVQGKKAFCYYATNGAFGEDVPSSNDLRFELQKKYPDCYTTGDLKCVLSNCDPRSAMSSCTYSIYYMEEKVSSRSDYESKYWTIRTDQGDSIYNYLDSVYVGEKLDKEPMVQIKEENFPNWYQYLYPYDLNGDGWLCCGELFYITDLEFEDPVAEVTGIEKLSYLRSITLRNYTGKKITIPEGTKIYDVCVFPNATKLTVDAPELTTLKLYTYYGNLSGEAHAPKMSSVDLSKCKGVEDLQISLGNCNVKAILPSSAPDLMHLDVTGVSNTSLNLTKYSNLESFRLYYSNDISSVDLSKNKKLKEVVVSRCKKMTKNKVKLPKGQKIQYNFYSL